MKRTTTLIALIVLVATVIADTAEARWRMSGRRRVRTTYTSGNYSNYSNYNVSYSGGPQEVAESKAELQASRNAMFHPGGGYGGGNAEGVGSGVTAQQALNNCCFTGQRRVLGQAVCQGSNGRWFACKIYQ